MKSDSPANSSCSEGTKVPNGSSTPNSFSTVDSCSVPRSPGASGRLSGTAWVFGSNVDTDAIIPARYLNTIEPAELASHCMEDLDPEFARKIAAGDTIVAGENFGCGSSREHAPLSIKAAGISCVIAASFARIFYRNAINIGLPVLESREAAHGIAGGHRVEVDMTAGSIRDLTTGSSYSSRALSEVARSIVSAGGLVPFVRAKLGIGGAGGGDAR